MGWVLATDLGENPGVRRVEARFGRSARRFRSSQGCGKPRLRGTSMPGESLPDRTDESNRLVSAICHEISNFVAAIRLQAHLIDEDLDRRALAEAVMEIDDLSARTASLLALIPPLSRPQPDASRKVPAGAIARQFERALKTHGARGCTFVFEIEEPLPDVRAEPEWLHDLLMCHAFGAMEAMEAMRAADAGRTLRFEVEATETEVIFAVEDVAREDADFLGWRQATLRGRALTNALSHCFLCRGGGGFDVRREGGQNRAELRAPRA